MPKENKHYKNYFGVEIDDICLKCKWLMNIEFKTNPIYDKQTGRIQSGNITKTAYLGCPFSLGQLGSDRRNSRISILKCNLYEPK